VSYLEEQMTESTTTAAAPRRSVGQWALVAVLGILGILAFVAAILFITGGANNIHFLSGSSHHGIHDIRLAVSIVAGVLLLAGAGYLARSSAKS
jgi:nicotinamide riboside transporter PnuC